MKPVKSLCIGIANNEIPATSDKSSKIQKLKKIWAREQNALVPFLIEKGYIKETDSMHVEENMLTIKLKQNFSIEQGVELVHILEKKYEVTSLRFEAEYDDFYKEKPFMLIFIKSKQ